MHHSAARGIRTKEENMHPLPRNKHKTKISVKGSLYLSQSKELRKVLHVRIVLSSFVFFHYFFPHYINTQIIFQTLLNSFFLYSTTWLILNVSCVSCAPCSYIQLQQISLSSIYIYLHAMTYPFRKQPYSIVYKSAMVTIHKCGFDLTHGLDLNHGWDLTHGSDLTHGLDLTISWI